MIDLKQVAQTILREAQKKQKAGGVSVPDRAYLEGELDTAQLFLTYILRNEDEQNGEKNMITNELTFKRVRLADIIEKPRLSKFETMIVELAGDLPPGDGEMINPKLGLKYGNFSTRVSKMRNQNKIGQDITTKKDGEYMYLVRLAEGQQLRRVGKKQTVEA